MNNKNQTSFKIPDELSQFLRNETYSLLVKGDPGTGKTALCLTLLRVLNIQNNFFYISTRVSPNKLFSYFTWVTKYLQIKGSGINDPSSNDDDSSEPFFADARLDEPESLFERITNQLMDVRSPLIIVDSWDGVASFMDKESRLNNERVLQTWLERAGGRLILVNEGTGLSTLDYLVDGVVTLQYHQYDEIAVREIILNKLRGINIQKNSYFYTLNNGIFKVFKSCTFPSFQSGQDTKHSSRDYIRQSRLQKISSGYSELDVNIGGGFPLRSIILLEYDPKLEMKSIMLFLSKFINQHIKNSNILLLDSSFTEKLNTILDNITQNKSQKTNFDKLVKSVDFSRIFQDRNQNKSSNLKNFVHTILKEPTRIKSYSQVFSIINMDTYKSQDYGKLLNNLKKNFAISFLLKRTDVPEIRYQLSSIADFHVKFLFLDEIFFLQLLYPYSQCFAIEIKDDLKFDHPIKLEPMI